MTADKTSSPEPGGRRAREACPLCGATQYKAIARSARLYSGLHVGDVRAAMDTVICRACGLVFRQPMPGEAEIAAYYQREYYEKYKGLAGEREFTAADLASMRKNREGYLDRYRAMGVEFDGKRVLDVGAGRGLLLEAIQRQHRPAFLHGIEPSLAMSRFCAEEMAYPFTVDCCDINQFKDMTSPGNRAGGYDLILLTGVLEHLARPLESLTSLHHFLAPGGQVVVQVPNEDPATNQRLFERISFVHVLYFTGQTLAAMCRRAGYEVEQVTAPHPKILVALLRQGPVAQPPALAAEEFRRLYVNYLIKVMAMPRYLGLKRLARRLLGRG